MCAARSLPTFAATKRPRGRPRKTPQERNEGNRRQDIVKAAAKLFRRNGFNGTSTRDIACAVGMHSGSLFCHFKSKDALLYEVMQEGMRSALARQTNTAVPLRGTALILSGAHPVVACPQLKIRKKKKKKQKN
mgnify:CR=1 FL=1